MVLFTAKQLRIIKTSNLFISSSVSGMSMAVAGPALLDLQHIVKTDTKHIAVIYTGRSSGYLLGTLIGGVILDIIARKQLFMTVLNFIIAVCMFAIPFSGRIEILTAWMVLNGMAMGALDTGLNVWCLDLWGKDSGPFYQALHFAFGAGGLIAPLIAAPFLGQYISAEDQTWNSTIAFTNQSTLTDMEDAFQDSYLSSGFTIPSVFYCYAIIGTIALLITVLFFVMSVISPFDDKQHKNDSEEIRKRGNVFVGSVVFLNFLLLFAVIGTQIGYAQVVATYAVKGPLELTPAIGSYVTSTFWGAFTLSRFSAIFLALLFSSLPLILFSLLVTIAGAAVLLFLAETHEWALWLASVLLGFGIAPFFPTTIAWIEQYITITNKFVALFSTGAAFGEMVIPYTVTRFMDDVPEALSYVVATTCAISVILVFCMHLLLRNKRNKYLEKDLIISNPACDVNLEREVAT